MSFETSDVKPPLKMRFLRLLRPLRAVFARRKRVQPDETAQLVAHNRALVAKGRAHGLLTERQAEKLAEGIKRGTPSPEVAAELRRIEETLPKD